MSSDSSSDSESNAQFREACDPNLSLTYNFKNFNEVNWSNTAQKERDEGLQIESLGSMDDVPEAKKSLLLVKKIKNILSSRTGPNFDFKGSLSGRSFLQTESPGMCRLLQRKRQHSSKGDFPSDLSPYLSKQLLKLLDEKVHIHEDTSKVSASGSVHHGQLFLLKNILIQSFINSTDEVTNKKQRVAPVDKFDKNEVALRCRSVALSAQYIMDKKDVYPWPDPKNVRYLERYKLKTKKPGGTIEVVPYNDDNFLAIRSDMSIIKDNPTETIRRDITAKENNQSKEIVKKKNRKTTSVNLLDHAGIKQGNTNVNSSTDKGATFVVRVKKRKQSRQRGGKKK